MANPPDTSAHAAGLRCWCSMHSRRHFTGLFWPAPRCRYGRGRSPNASAPPSRRRCRPSRSSTVPASSTGRCCSRRPARARWRRRTTRSCERLRYIAQRIIPYTRRVQRARTRLAVGGQPDRQPGAQRVLHAGRQDRVLLRHPRQAAARPTTRSQRSWATRSRTRCSNTRASGWARPSPRRPACGSAPRCWGWGSVGEWRRRSAGSC